ncbi:uncharacterized protein LOC117781425 [Drosophila innubila]|uniref:uncharacterized protein LOC117781425 n=1 Tax=Drosophila innubila TaxID=198719 RepID=UPI00148BCF12|nr:uncharacterized protein LOC117781425 [Drosophila innubila]
MALDDFFYKLKSRTPGLVENIWQVLLNANSTSPDTSITLSQIRDRYYELTEESFPRMGEPRVEMLFILSIPFVAAFSNSVGTLRFYILDYPESLV